MDENLNQEAQPVLEAEPQGFPVKKIISLIIGLIIIIGLAVVFFIFILPNFKSKKATNATLTYWGVWEDPSVFNDISAEFTRQHPNITVKYEKQDVKALGKYIERLATRMDNGTGPDIFRYHNSWITELKNYLLPLPSDVVKSTELDSKFYPVVAQDLKIKGAYYGIPVHFDTLALFINTNLFKSAGITTYPQTWDDLITASRQLTVKDSTGKIITSGVALGTFDNISSSSDIISLLLLQNGADLTNLNGPAKKSSSDALDFYTSFAKGDAKVWDDSLENSELAFAKANLAMFFGYSWNIFDIKALNPNLQFTVIPAPHLPGRETQVASYWVEGVSAKTKNSDAAFEFLKFLGSKDTMEKLYAKASKVRLFGELYPRADMAEMLKTNTLIYPFVQEGKNAKSTIFSSGTYDDAMVDSLNSYLGNAVRSIINDSTSPQSAVDTLSQGVAQVLGRYEGTKTQ